MALQRRFIGLNTRSRRTDHVRTGLHARGRGIVSKRKGSRYVSGRCDAWLKVKNPAAPAIRREAEEDWGRRR
jgi:ATP-dependent DNA ligase